MNNLLKNKLKADYENLTENASASLWDKINERLENEKVEKKTFILPIFWKYAAVVLLLISVGFILKFISSDAIDQPLENKEMVSSPKAKSSIDITTLNKENTAQEEVIAKTEKVKKNQERTFQHLVHQTKTIAPEELVKNETLIVSTKQEQKENTDPELVAAATKEPLVVQTKPAEKTKYVTATELLFEREANKTLQNQTETMVTAELLQKPKQIKILGFTVYTDSQQ